MVKITPQDLDRRLKSGERLQLLDVRSTGEFASGHLPGAVNVPLEELAARAADLRADEPLVLVCQSGRRACMGHDTLIRHRSDLIVLEGGTAQWVSAGLPVVRTTASAWSLERQVRLTAGLLVLAGTALSVTVAPGWVYLAMFVGAGLTFAGLTNVCGMAALFAAMPWNKPRSKANPAEVRS